ncbi:hypothetical protein CPLU01_01300 [Colletotrichum plurivorum]|uniref:Uncharacterized protein n=1 Tax=Colletotrichum plurivorum TaxID=2175906 RepID=A0A8H6U4Q8_9PEZI|nr:hypothetical protein CPLU01_01300 [Colletotrichum plurivorum]
MQRLCGMRPEGLTVNSRFSPLPSMCFFDTIIIPLPAWIRIGITFAFFHFVVPVLIVDKIKRYQVKKEWQRHAQLSFYYFSILVVFLMEAMEIARLAQIRYAIGLLPFVFAGCGVSAAMQATRGAKGRIRNWQVANIIFWIMSVAVTIIKILTIQRSSMRSPEFRRMNTDYPTTHQVQDLAVIAAFYFLLFVNEVALFFQKTWEETVNAENIKRLGLTRSISDQARYDLTRAMEDGYYPSGVTYLTLRLEGESTSEKDVPGGAASSKEHDLKKTTSHNTSVAGSSSSEKTGRRIIDDDSIEPVPMIPPSFRRSERWSSAMTLQDAGADEPLNEQAGGKKRGSERWSSAMTLKEPAPIRDPSDKRGSGLPGAKASPTFENIDETAPLEPATTSSSRYTDERAATKAMLADSPFPVKQPHSPAAERRSFLLKPGNPNPNAERWSSAMTLRGEPTSPGPSGLKEQQQAPTSATAPTTPERKVSGGERNSMRRYSDCSSRSIRRFSARSDLREAAATAAAFVDGEDPPSSPEVSEHTHLQSQQPPSP